MISVLMPVYNGELYLKEAIDSILNQTFADFEFLIINDGSTDRSEEIIESYSDERIRYIKNEGNIGLIRTLNKGLDLARNKYIARMDADDIALPHRFEKQVEFMEANPEIAASGSNIIRFYGDINGKTNPSNVKTQSKELKIRVLFYTSFWHPTMIIRNKVLKDHNLKYKIDYKLAEDKMFWIDISHHGSMANVKDELLYYRVHENQVSTEYFSEQYAMSMSITREALSNLSIDMSRYSDKIVGYIAYPQRCSDVSELYQAESFMEDVVKVLSNNSNYDSIAVKRFMKERITKTLEKSQNIGFPLISYIYKSSYVDISEFDLRYFFKVLLKRNTKKIN